MLQDGTNTYVYGLDLMSSTNGSGAQTYFLYDGLGSTTGLTDGAGNNLVSYSYDAFGAIRSQSVPSANYWLFTGEQRDSGSNFYYLRALLRSGDRAVPVRRSVCRRASSRRHAVTFC